MTPEKVATKPKRLNQNALDNLRAFIAFAQEAMPYSARWHDHVWDITASDIHMRSHKRNKKSLYFTEHARAKVPHDRRNPFAQPFADLTKACIVRRRINRGMDSGPQAIFARAARYLYGSCPLNVRLDPTLLSLNHFILAEAAAFDREMPSSAYKLGQLLEEFASFIDRYRLARGPIDYRSSIPRPMNLIDRTSSAFEERIKGLPTPEMLDALACIANDPSLHKTPFDLLRMRSIELLFVAGFRIGEMLTAPADLLVRKIVLDKTGEPRRDPVTGDVIERIGLRYWPEKGGEPLVKWVPRVANVLVLRAVADIERSCVKARENAKWLEQHPGKVHAGIVGDRRYTMAEVASLLGIERHYARLWVTQRRRCATLQRTPSGLYIMGSELEAAIASDRYEFPVLTRDDGKRQTLSESLFVIFMHESHARRSVNRFISVPVTFQHIQSFIAGKAGVPSVFERYGFRSDTGESLRINSHGFRRLLSTIAERGGLSQVEIARWMGRRNIGDNATYDYRTSAEMASDMRKLILNNEVFGAIVEQVRTLPEKERESFLASRVAMIHATPYGHCASNVAESPCETALSCVAGCRHFLYQKGNEKARARLLLIEQEAITGLARAEEAQSQGKYNAENWISAQHTTLKHVRAAWAIDEDIAIEHGALERVSPDGPVIGEPL